MATQTLTIPTFTILRGIPQAANLRIPIDDAIAGGSGRTLATLTIQVSTVEINTNGGDLSDAFETGGTITLARSGAAWTSNAPNPPDRSEPYTWDAPGGLRQSAVAGPSGWTLTLDDGVSPAIRNIYRGGQQVQRIYRGNTEIIRVYRGGTQIFGEVP